MISLAPDDRPVRRRYPHVVAIFAGRSGSGKTTLARAVQAIMEHGRHVAVCRESFARPLKDELIGLGVSREHLMFRKLAQRIGDLRRAADVDHYVSLLCERVDAHDIPHVFLVDDGRRKNEGPVGDLVFRLVTSRPSALTAEEQAHPSETEWSERRPRRTSPTTRR